MEEKTVLLQSTPGSEVIGKLSPGDVEGQQARGSRESSSINGAKEFPRAPLGGEGGEKTCKGRFMQPQLS